MSPGQRQALYGGPSTARITFEGGALESQEDSNIPNGFLKTCVNWVPEPSGGLRVRAKWFPGSTTGAPPTRRCRGIGMLTRFTKPSVVQTSTSTKVAGNVTAFQPVSTWATATQLGNLLLCVISYTNLNSVAAPTLTPSTGWVTRAGFSGTARQQTAILEYPNASSQQGDVTPFTITTVSNASLVIWLIEVSGTAGVPFDVSGTATSTTTTVAPSTATTTQASEFVLAVDTTRKSGTVANTLSTATANWNELVEDGQANFTTYHDAAIYFGTRTATGTQTLTITSSVAVDHAAILLTYKGWYSFPAPPPVGELWLAAHDNTATFDIYSVARSTLGAGATFATVDTALGSSTAGEPVAFTLGLGAAYYTTPTFTALRKYDGTAVTAVTNGPPGRCVAVHGDRLWVGGTSAIPSRLHFSQIGDGSTWTGTGTGYWEFGRDDGEAIEDITPAFGGLVVGKKTSLWFLDGNTTDTFQRIALNAGSAAPGRSVLATPYGVIIAGPEQVWFFDGQTVSPIGRGIERSYGVPDGSFVSMSYIDGSIYIAVGANAQIYVFNIDQGVWHIEEVGEAPAVLYNYGPVQLFGPVAGTTMSLLNYRSFPDPVRGPEAALPTTYTMQTGDVAYAGSRRPLTVRQLYLQTRQRSDGDTGLTVTPFFNGVAGDDCSVATGEVGVARGAVSGFPQSAGSATPTAGFSITQMLGAGESSCFDIEDAYLDFMVEGPRTS